jgi:hypothetical protein
MARNSPSLKSLIKTGFGISIGFFLSHIIFIGIGLAFFIPGYIMFLKASKDKKESSGSQITGLILMGVGVIIMGGMGFGFLMNSIGDMALD